MVWKSALERFPEHARLIGMVSIENANLELALADLLAAVLLIPRKVAHAIYFTPRAAMLRLEILEAAATARLAGRRLRTNNKIEEQKRNALRKVGGIVKRCRAHIQNRHNIIHDLWDVSTYHSGEVVQDVVFRQKIGTAMDFMDFKVVAIVDLQQLCDGFRRLIDDARELSVDLRSRPPMMADLRN